MNVMNVNSLPLFLEQIYTDKLSRQQLLILSIMDLLIPSILVCQTQLYMGNNMNMSCIHNLEDIYIYICLVIYGFTTFTVRTYEL